ncbi:dna replication protein [Fructilactobacillus fructivorans]|nr:dna replication protein [Fructilactobacillus fructivorans]
MQELQKSVKRRSTYNMLKRSSIMDDPDLKRVSFNDYQERNSETKKNKQLAENLAIYYTDRNNKGNAIISGKAGVGKSHLAYSILRYVNNHAEPMQSCLFVDFNELLRRIKGSFHDKTSPYREESMVSLLSGVDLLVLDDLGSEATFQTRDSEASNWAQNVLYAILNHRNRTIVTTNLSGEQMLNIYNDKVVSRVMKGSQDKIIKFKDTKDYRARLF